MYELEANSDYVLIEPVKYVAAPATPCPNCRFGWVTTSSEDAERFPVRIGEQKYHDLMPPYLVNGGITNEKAVSVPDAAWLSALRASLGAANRECQMAEIT